MVLARPLAVLVVPLACLLAAGTLVLVACSLCLLAIPPLLMWLAVHCPSLPVRAAVQQVGKVVISRSHLA